MNVTSEQLSQCAEKIASYGFTDRVDGYSIQTLIANAANDLSKERLIVKILTKKLEEALGASGPRSETLPMQTCDVKELLSRLGYISAFFETEELGLSKVLIKVKQRRSGKALDFIFLTKEKTAKQAVSEITKAFEGES